MSAVREEDPNGFAQVRRDFPAATEQTYVDIASCAPVSHPVLRAITAYLSDPAYGVDKQASLALVEETRSLFARLINAQSHEIAFIKNVSEGLNFIANAMDWKQGDNIVMCPSLEHPNNRYLWHNLAARVGVEIRLVPMRGNQYPIEDMLVAMDSRTRLVTLSSVTYVPGFRVPLERLSSICRRNDTLLLVDAAQSVGPLHTDVQALGIDALAVSTQKGLLGIQGMGFLFVREEWSRRLRPQSIARFGVDETVSAGKGVIHEPLTLQRGAKRFDLGNYNLVGVIAARESLSLLTNLGTTAIETHNVELAKRLSAGLYDLGLPVCMPDDPGHQVHVVSLGSLDTEHDPADIDRLLRLYQHLAEHRVRASWRNGILRFSMHVYNDGSDVDIILALVKDFVTCTQP